MVYDGVSDFVVILQYRFAIQCRQCKTVSVDAFDSDDKAQAGVLLRLLC